MDTTTIIILLTLLLFLAGSAFTSAAETIITSVSRIKVKQRAEEGDKKAQILDQMLKQPSGFLGTILLLNNLLNIASASMATVLAEKYVSSPVAVATGIMTFIILVFAEITPKTFAIKTADKLAFTITPIVNIFQIILGPIVRTLIFISNGVLRIFGSKARKEGPFITEDEIRTLVSVGEEEGVIEKHEKELINSIFEFGDTIVKEVMIPRMDMIAVEKKVDVIEVLKTVKKHGLSRIPVFNETIDNVIGVAYARDLLMSNSEKEKMKPTIKEIMRPAYYVPETKRVIELLKELQNEKVHMAIVLDEYGGTSGLVTIEDLLEEIVGEIFDEYDAEEVLIKKIAKNKFKVHGKVDLDEVNKTLKLNLPDAEYESIGGFVISLFGKIPKSGESINFDGLIFTIEKAQRRRIEKLLITKEKDVSKEDK